MKVALTVIMANVVLVALIYLGAAFAMWDLAWPPIADDMRSEAVTLWAITAPFVSLVSTLIGASSMDS